MKRSVYRLKAGNINRLKITEEVMPVFADDEVQVAVKSIGLNFADVFAILGLYSATPKGDFIPGLEYAGEVMAVGKKVKQYKKGDRVMGVTRFGAYASHINIASEYLSPLPATWSYDEGASYLVQVLTAYYGLKELGAIKQKATVLIHSAAGGVGLWANRIAKTFDAFTIGTVGAKEKIKFCLKEGYDQVILRDERTFKRELKNALLDRPLDLVMECIGGKIMKQGIEALAPMGRSIIYGSAHYTRQGDRPFYPLLIWKYLRRPKIDPQNMIKENKGILAFNLIYLFDHPELMHRLIKELSMLHLGTPIVGHTYSFEELPAAIRYFQTGKTKGKVVVKIKY